MHSIHYYDPEMPIQVRSRSGHENLTGREHQCKGNKFKPPDSCANQTPLPTETPLTRAEIKAVK